MREIKFRAWDLNAKRYLSQQQMTEIGGFYYNYGVAPDPHEFALEQYTGLKDKNGKELYEGDVVKIGNKKSDDTTDIAEVKWFRGGMMLKLKGYFGYRDIERFDKDCELHEVIGNIHENPELIKV